MARKGSKSLFLAVGVAYAGIVAVISLAMMKELNNARSAHEWLTHSMIVKEHIHRVQGILTAAESQARGYVITGNASFRREYEESLAHEEELSGNAATRELTTLETMTADNPRQTERLRALRTVVEERLGLLAHGVELTDDGRKQAAADFISTGAGQRAMRKVNDIIDAMGAEEDSLLVTRRQKDEMSETTNVHMIAGLSLALLATSLLALLLILREFQRRRSREKALREDTAFQRAILDSSLYTIIATDEHGVIRLFNRSAEKTFGYSAAEMIGRDAPHVLHQPEDAASRAAQMSEELSRNVAPGFGVNVQKPEAEGSEEREWIYMRKDGTPLTMLSSITALRDDQGHLTGYLGISKDVTEIKRAERRLRESEETFRLAMEHASIGMALVSLDGRWLRVNQALCMLTGYSREEMLKTDFQTLTHPDDLETDLEHVRALLGGHSTSYEMEKRYIHRNGHMIWVLLNVSLVRDSAGEPQYFVAQIQDISVRKAGDRMKNEFISTVSHELRTPLTSIRGSLGLISSNVAGEIAPQARQLVDIAYNNSERLVRLVNDILDIEKIEAGSMRLDRRPVELASALRQSIAENQGFADKYHVSLMLRNEAAGAHVHGDSDRLLQVIANLLSNAIKYSAAGGIVTLAARRSGKGIVISVTDRGTGIPEEFKPRIFGKFARADGSDARQKEGTGLGLSICKSIVEMMGGRIGFTSEPGHTEFFVDLPEHGAPQSAAAAEGETSGRVLVCEDDGAVAEFIAGVLVRSGFEAHIAGSAEAAKILLSDEHFDAMTLDLGLPGQNGMALIRELRAQKATQNLPIVVVSARAEAGRQVMGEALNILDWLPKPVDTERLRRVLAAVGKPGKRPVILHVEDNHDIRDIIALSLHRMADTVSAPTLAAARYQMRRTEFDLVILDIDLPDGSGIDLLPDLCDRPTPVPVVILSVSEIPAEIQRRVSASLVKSVVSEDKIVQTIRQAIRREAS